MPNILQGDPPPILAAWFAEHGAQALQELVYRSKISAPTLRKIYRRQPVRADVALKLCEFLGLEGRHKELTEPQPARTRKVAKKRRHRAA